MTIDQFYRNLAKIAQRVRFRRMNIAGDYARNGFIRTKDVSMSCAPGWAGQYQEACPIVAVHAALFPYKKVTNTDWKLAAKRLKLEIANARLIANAADGCLTHLDKVVEAKTRAVRRKLEHICFPKRKKAK